MKKVLVLILVVLMMFSSTALAYNVSEPGVIPVVDEVVDTRSLRRIPHISATSMRTH